MKHDPVMTEMEQHPSITWNTTDVFCENVHVSSNLTGKKQTKQKKDVRP